MLALRPPVAAAQIVVSRWCATSSGSRHVAARQSCCPGAPHSQSTLVSALGWLWCCTGPRNFQGAPSEWRVRAQRCTAQARASPQSHSLHVSRTHNTHCDVVAVCISSVLGKAAAHAIRTMALCRWWHRWALQPTTPARTISLARSSRLLAAFDAQLLLWRPCRLLQVIRQIEGLAICSQLQISKE